MTDGTWTRDHDRLARAWLKLELKHYRNRVALGSLRDWCGRKFGETRIWLLTVQQCRQGRRCINAWRHSIKGNDI